MSINLTQKNVDALKKLRILRFSLYFKDSSLKFKEKYLKLQGSSMKFKDMQWLFFVFQT